MLPKISLHFILKTTSSHWLEDDINIYNKIGKEQRRQLDFVQDLGNQNILKFSWSIYAFLNFFKMTFLK